MLMAALGGSRPSHLGPGPILAGGLNPGRAAG